MSEPGPKVAVKELKAQLISALLVVLTAAALILAGVNFREQKRFHLPEDGATWVERPGANGSTIVTALYIRPGSPVDNAGIRIGDILTKINNTPVHSAVDASVALAKVGAYGQAEYTLVRGGIEFKVSKVVIQERATGTALYYQYIVGLFYIAMGLFVYLRRGRAPRATHFYVLCLVSFVLSTFHYTGSLDTTDKVIYWGNVIAGLFAPTIFLHFTLVFPRPRKWVSHGWQVALLYVPATAFSIFWVSLASGTVRITIPPISLSELRWTLDRAWLVFLSAFYLLGALALTLEFRRTTDPLLRQQLRWLRNGAVLGVVPFTCGYVFPFLMGKMPTPFMDLMVLPLLLIPLTWAYAVLRYRLMDVDLILRQGYAYTLATLAVLGIFYGLIQSTKPLDEMEAPALIVLILIAAFVFQPIRNWMQQMLDRYWFYKDRYDYRHTLIEFARELSSETNLAEMLQSVGDRIRGTLSVQKVAVFLSDEGREGYSLFLYSGPVDAPPGPLDFSFLTPNPTGPIFFDQTWHQLDIAWRDWSPAVRQTVAKLDLTYYIPCRVRGRTIAYLGISRTNSGDFLTSEDIELLTTLSGSVGIAIENARLYHSLQRKASEYERLKEFSENIVESINVGIVAADLDDHVESWNSQMESLTGISREMALDQRVSDLFPRRLAAALEEVRGEKGVHQIYKLPVRERSWRTPSAAGQNGSSPHDDTLTGVSASSLRSPKERLVNVAVAPLFTKDQAQIGRLIIFDDVTDRAAMEQQLVQADKLSSIGLLAAGVAHEVNTPLAVISTYAQMLTRQVAGDEQKSKLLEKIAKQTFRASEIVNSLLNFSRTSNTEFEEVDLNRVIRETLSLLEHQLMKARVEVQFEDQLVLPPVRGNAGRLQQVFLNLILNARDAMPEGGVLKVSSRSDDGVAYIEVADTGKGIDAADLGRIYDPFFTTKPPKQGTGLGLSVTYGIVREHGGAIDVKSRPGHGTTFILTFPLVRKAVAVS